MRDKIKKIFLESNGEFVSGEELSTQLHISRTAIWKQITELKKEGYQFDAVRRKGYRLLYSPDDISPSRLKEKLNNQWLGNKIHYYKITESTQKVAHELAKDGAEHGTIIIADEQTKGKGRLGRTWYSEKGKGIWLSFIIRPNFSFQQAPLITLFTSLMVFDTLEKLYNINIKIKWPNDIYINERKCAGILTEMHGEQDKIHYLVIGVGINTHQAKYPAELNDKAISIEEAISNEPRRIDIICEFLHQFEKNYNLFTNQSFKHFQQIYNKRLLWQGERKTILNQGNELNGVLEGIDENGHLTLKKDNGETIRLFSGEIT